VDAVTRPPPLLVRLWIYQGERFPLVRTVPLLGVFSAASVTASAHLGHRPLPPPAAYVVAFWLALTFFWQMRAADEAKDAETDRRYRPERPIPRGLVSLRLIVGMGIAAAVPAALAALCLVPALVLLVGAVWAWLGLMTAEFFAPARLRASPTLYLVSHMAIMPLIDLALTACEWLPAAGIPPAGLWTFLWMSFCNGCVVEFGRKIWAPEQERPGVETYSSSWGIRSSLLAFSLAATGALIGLVVCGSCSGRAGVAALAGLAGLGGLLVQVGAFWRAPAPLRQKRLENASGLWVLVCYLSAALAPSLPAVG
jgi:4-hydroxybenzoate polyprenyltransferase